MTTLSNNGGFGEVFEEDNTITNKPLQQKESTPQNKKCKTCDNTVRLTEEVCAQCFAPLNESTTSNILLD